MALRGTMIMESLLSGVVLEGVELHVTRIARGDVGDVDAGQPLAWTVIDFEAAEADAERLTRWCQDSLRDGTWYCDLRSDSETFVVFSGRTFRYERNDVAGRDAVVSFGRARGIPESQLDWP